MFIACKFGRGTYRAKREQVPSIDEKGCDLQEEFHREGVEACALWRRERGSVGVGGGGLQGDVRDAGVAAHGDAQRRELPCLGDLGPFRDVWTRLSQLVRA